MYQMLSYSILLKPNPKGCPVNFDRCQHYQKIPVRMKATMADVWHIEHTYQEGHTCVFSIKPNKNLTMEQLSEEIAKLQAVCEQCHKNNKGRGCGTSSCMHIELCTCNKFCKLPKQPEIQNIFPRITQRCGYYVVSPTSDSYMPENLARIVKTCSGCILYRLKELGGHAL